MASRAMLPYEQRLVLVKRSIRPGPRQPARLQRLAQEASIDPAELEMWLDAYEAGRESGLRTVEAAATPAADVLKGTAAAIGVWLETTYGSNRHFKVTRKAGTISVAETRSPTDGAARAKAIERFQIRAGDDNGWHLYYRRAGKWWPYHTSDKRGRPRPLDDCLHEVMTDPLRRFWA